MFRANNYKDSSAKQDCRSHISHLSTHLALSLKKIQKEVPRRGVLKTFVLCLLGGASV